VKLYLIPFIEKKYDYVKLVINNLIQTNKKLFNKLVL
jgi:hypothetical protein